MNASVYDKVINIIAKQAVVNVASVRPESSPSSLGIDSLGQVEAIFAIEEAFDIMIPFNANTPGESGFDASSMRAIVAAVEKLIVLKAG